MPSENGWNPAKASPDQCEWITVPGTSVTLQLLKDIPSTIMRAYAADYNAYVEPLRDPDSAGWTPTNSVATSNHLNGTAMDLNWNSHPFRVADAGYTPQMIATMRELLDFYENTMFWSNDWDDPKDAMHHQMDYGTYEDQAHCRDFIARKIRPDGFSTFRRGNSVALSTKDTYALAIITQGQRLGISPKGIQIALATTLVETNLTMYANRNVPESLGYPHDAVGSDHDSTGLFQQRQAWGPLSETMDPALSARLFFNGGHAGQRGLTDFDYNSDARTPGGWAQAVQVSAFPTRYDGRYPEAVDLYNRLVAVSSTESADPFEEILMLSAPSLSIYATPGEPPVPVVDMIRALDAHGPHEPYVEAQARAGDYDALTRVARTAAGKGIYGTAPGPVRQAAAVLADIEATNPAILQAFNTRNGAQQ